MFPEVAVVFRHNNYGLTQDAEILRSGLESMGVGVTLLDRRKRTLIDRLRRRTIAHTIIHLERIHPAWLGAAANHVLIPNQERFPRRHIGRLGHIDRVLAKTHHAHEIFSGLCVDSTFMGFTSTDLQDPSTPKDWSRFFHLAGGSTLKGTEDILALWAVHPEWPELIMVQKEANAPRSVPANVRLLCGYVEQKELRRLQNMCGIHLCPSRSEGWGHNIVEAMSCGSVVVTTDAPPMNEHITPDCGVLVRTVRAVPRHLGRNFFVELSALEAAISQLASKPSNLTRLLGTSARNRFEEIDRNFTLRLHTIFGAACGTPESRSHRHRVRAEPCGLQGIRTGN